MRFLHLILGTIVGGPLVPARRDERGLSQSTEIAILTGAVVVIVAIIITAITAYVNAKLPRP